MIATSTPSPTTVSSASRSRRLSCADEHVHVGAQRPHLVAHPAADGRVVGGDRIEHRADGDGWGQVQLEVRRAPGVRPEGGGEADDDLQPRTAVFTHTTGGRWRATSVQVPPASAEAKTSPVRVPT